MAPTAEQWEKEKELAESACVCVWTKNETTSERDSGDQSLKEAFENTGPK